MGVSDSKKAILVVSFGTSYAETREKTIYKIEQEICESYPNHPVYRAWTSRMIIKKLKERDGIHIDNVCEAMERMVNDGIREAAVLPTHIMGGIENDRMTADILKYEDQFEKIVIGAPLLSCDQDIVHSAEAVMDEFGKLQPDEALIFMGHGTSHQANEVYVRFEDALKKCGHENVFVGTVEGFPTLDDMIEKMREKNFRKIHLAPLMLVAGDHAVNDMSGDEKQSWKSCFEEEGYKVECHLKGLGEYSGVRKIFLMHLQEAMERI